MECKLVDLYERAGRYEIVHEGDIVIAVRSVIPMKKIRLIVAGTPFIWKIFKKPIFRFPLNNFPILLFQYNSIWIEAYSEDNINISNQLQVEELLLEQNFRKQYVKNYMTDDSNYYEDVYLFMKTQYESYYDHNTLPDPDALT